VSLAGRRLEKIPTPREGKYDAALRAILTRRPTATANAIARAYLNKEDWAEPLWSKFFDVDEFFDLDVTTIRRALKRIRGVTTTQ
jgi:hypothetical protein